jgi:colicin import membrane protein
VEQLTAKVRELQLAKGDGAAAAALQARLRGNRDVAREAVEGQKAAEARAAELEARLAAANAKIAALSAAAAAAAAEKAAAAAAAEGAAAAAAGAKQAAAAGAKQAAAAGARQQEERVGEGSRGLGQRGRRG